jgi:hypothetical protein
MKSCSLNLFEPNKGLNLLFSFDSLSNVVKRKNHPPNPSIFEDLRRFAGGVKCCQKM